MSILEMCALAPTDVTCGCIDHLRADGRLPNPLSPEADDAFARSRAAMGDSAARMAWADAYPGIRSPLDRKDD